MMEAETLKYRIGGMDCAACVTKIETAVSRLPGVGAVRVSLAARTMTVRGDGTIAAAAVERQVKAFGYSIAPVGGGRPDAEAGPGHGPDAHDHGDAGHHHDHDHGAAIDGPWWQTAKARLIFGAGAALAAAYVAGLIVPAVGHWAFVVAMLVGLVPIARRALRGSAAPARRSRSRR